MPSRRIRTQLYGFRAPQSSISTDVIRAVYSDFSYAEGQHKWQWKHILAANKADSNNGNTRQGGDRVNNHSNRNNNDDGHPQLNFFCIFHDRLAANKLENYSLNPKNRRSARTKYSGSPSTANVTG